MADRGAKCLILLSRSGQKTSAAKALVESLASQGVRVETPQCDITDPEVLRAALEICPKSGMPAVKGCIQAAMQLQVSVTSILHLNFGPIGMVREASES